MALEIPLSWKLSVQGAENIKQKLQDINNQFNRGEISADDYDKGLIKVNRSARSLANILTTEKNIFLATHPIINRLSRSMSTLAHVSRSALDISNSLNLMWIRQNGTASEKLEFERNIAESQRTINRLTLEGKTNTQEYADAVEQLNIDQAKLKELNEQDFQQNLNNVITLFSSLGTTIGVLTPNIIKLILLLKELKIAHLALAPAVWASAGPYGLIAGGIALVGFAIYELIKAFQAGPVAWAVVVNKVFQPMIDMFTIRIPTAIAQSILLIKVGLTSFANVILSVINELGSGLTEGLNAIIKSIESFINGFIIIYNSIASKLSKLGVKVQKLDLITLPTVTFTAIPLIAAAKGFEGMVSNPTMFLAGEAGPEYVSVTPRGSSGGVTQQINVTINAGSIIYEQQLFQKIDDYFKSKLRGLGFSGF